jgi:hypothetical protein
VVTEVLSGNGHGGDFIAFYSAGQLYSIRGDASPYDLSSLREAEHAERPSLRFDSVWIRAGGVAPYRNPPFYLPVVGFFAQFPLPVAFALSTVMAGLLLGGLLAITAGLVARHAMPVPAITWVAVSLAYYHVWQGIEYGQLPAYIVALGFTAGIILLGARQPCCAGLTFALLWLKAQYVPPVALFLFAVRERRALVGLLIGSCALVLLSILLVGPAGMRLYLESTLQVTTAPRELYFSNYHHMLNWRALLDRALASSHPAWIFPAQLVLMAVTYIVAVWGWTAPTRGIPWRQDARLLLLALAMILAGPHVHGQDLILLLPALAVVMGHLWRQEFPWPVTLASALGLLLFYWTLSQREPDNATPPASILLLACVFIASAVVLRTGSKQLPESSGPAGSVDKQARC